MKNMAYLVGGAERNSPRDQGGGLAGAPFSNINRTRIDKRGWS